MKTNTLDERTKVAEGCGQRGTYIYVCNKCPDEAAAILLKAVIVDDCNCTWHLDSVRTKN